MSTDEIFVETANRDVRNANFMEHIAAGDYEFYSHLVSERGAVVVFLDMDNLMADMLNHVGQTPELSEKDRFWFVANFFQIARRDLRNAFWLSLRRMNYNGMLILRVALEASKFAYMMHQDPDLLDIWVRKGENQKAYKKAFRFTDPPDDMPYRKDILELIESIGDFWAHPNLGYFSSSVEIDDGEIRTHHYDKDAESFFLCLKAVIRSYMMILGVFGKIFEDRYPIYMASKQEKLFNLAKKYEACEKHYDAKAKNPPRAWERP